MAASPRSGPGTAEVRVFRVLRADRPCRMRVTGTIARRPDEVRDYLACARSDGLHQDLIEY